MEALSSTSMTVPTTAEDSAAGIPPTTRPEPSTSRGARSEPRSNTFSQAAVTSVRGADSRPRASRTPELASGLTRWRRPLVMT